MFDKAAYNRRWYHANKERARETARVWRKRTGYMRKRTLQEKYSLTVEDWDAMFEAQGGACAVCPAIEPGNKQGWSTDHDHASGRVRGILCHGCNMALGGAKDNPTTLRALADYIERSRT